MAWEVMTMAQWKRTAYRAGDEGGCWLASSVRHATVFSTHADVRA